MTTLYKKCGCCQLILPLEENFWPNRHGRWPGWSSYCKECKREPRSAWMYAWRKKHPVEEAIRQHEYDKKRKNKKVQGERTHD